MTAADTGGETRARVASGLVASVPGLDTAGAQRALAVARADHGRALREVDALLTEHPVALVTTPVVYPLALVRLAHALIEAGYQAVAAPACAGCGKITTDLRRSIASGRAAEPARRAAAPEPAPGAAGPGGSMPGVPRAGSARPAMTRTSRW